MRVYWFLFFFFCIPGIAWAYVDPGSIAIFLQVAAAFAVGALITMRSKISQFFTAVVRFFSPGKSNSSSEKPDDDA